ncbi:unnamed protein product, partial [Darwinula stevensoni]
MSKGEFSISGDRVRARSIPESTRRLAMVAGPSVLWSRAAAGPTGSPAAVDRSSPAGRVGPRRASPRRALLALPGKRMRQCAVCTRRFPRSAHKVPLNAHYDARRAIRDLVGPPLPSPRACDLQAASCAPRAPLEGSARRGFDARPDPDGRVWRSLPDGEGAAGSVECQDGRRLGRSEVPDRLVVKEKESLKMRIVPSRRSHTTPVDHHTDALWQSLKSVLEKILRKDCYGLSSEELQRAVRVMVLNRQGRKLYAGLRRVVARHLEEEAGEEALRRAEEGGREAPRGGGPRGSAGVATERLPPDAHPGLDRPQDLPGDHEGHPLSHMERVYVPQHGVEDVYGLGLALFRDHVIKYGEIKEQLKEALSDMVTRERRGEAVDRSMIRDITTMLAMLGGHIYKRVFEDPFLQLAVEFYRVKSRNFLEGGSSVREEESRTNVEKEGSIQEAEDESRCDHMATIVEEENQKPPLEGTASDIQPFIRHVRSWTEREARRASRYGVGKRALRRAMTDALILDNLDAIVARESPEIARMLRDGSAEELRSRYDLHSSVPEGSNITAKCVSAYI